MPRILVTGKQGQVGFELMRSLSVLGEVVGVERSDCDLTDPVAITALLNRLEPDVIVNPAAYTAVDKAVSDPATAQAVNETAPATMAAWAAQHDALLVHYSTDYVFDGSKASAYVESDVPAPQSVYGQTKLAGEKAVLASRCRHLIFRTSWVYSAHGGNFLKTMLRLAAERDHLKIVADQFGAPTAASLIADATAQILGRYFAGGNPKDFPFGIYHLTAAGKTSWHGYAQLVASAAAALGWSLRADKAAIEPIPTSAYPLPASRPANSCLDTGKLQRTFGLVLPDWQSGVLHVLKQLKR